MNIFEKVTTLRNNEILKKKLKIDEVLLNAFHKIREKNNKSQKYVRAIALFQIMLLY